MVKCNMTDTEQTEAIELFPCEPSMEELERSKHYFTRYLFYDTWGRKGFREYFCPFCGRFEVKRPYDGYDVYQDDPFALHHNDTARCPLCGEEMVLKCLGRVGKRRSLYQSEKIGFIRSAGGMLTVSVGTAERDFCREDLDPLPWFHERYRYVVEPGKRQMWAKRDLWEGGWQLVGHQWEPRKTFTEPYARTYYMGYSRVGGEVGFVGAENIMDTSMRYCCAEDAFMSEIGEEIDDRFEGAAVWGLLQYLGEYSRRPQLEMLVKLGHTDVVRALLEDGSIDRTLVNWAAKTPAAFFRVSKREYAALRKVPSALKAMYRYREDQPEGMDLVEYLETWSVMDDDAGTFFKICKKYGAMPKKAAVWLRNQNMDLGDAVKMWKDYIFMAESLERDMTFRRNLFPADLQDEHDAAVRLCEQVKKEQEIKDKKAYRKRFRRLRKVYEYTDGELSIVVPASEDDITREGKELKHCVGGYARRHVEGKTTILFLRKADDLKTPYVTIEINDETHQLRQVHGYRNERDGAEPPLMRNKEFFDEWREWLRRGSPRTPKGVPIRPDRKEKEVKTA